METEFLLSNGRYGDSTLCQDANRMCVACVVWIISLDTYAMTVTFFEIA